jgi:hypothetical protein
MARSEQNTNEIGRIGLWTTVVALAVSVCLIVAATDMQAQTFTVLHTLNGGSDGSGAISGLVADRAGNLYGVAYAGGIPGCPFGEGCGTVFKLTHGGSGWIFSVIYSFTGAADGWWPQNIAFAADGSIFGTTIFGGDTNECTSYGGCGTVFRLQPPPNFCAAFSCPWRKTTLYEFTDGDDGRYPNGPAFDAAGNVYGTTNEAAENGAGNIWELSPSGSGWTFNVLYAFEYYSGGNPIYGVSVDGAGNLWGSGGTGNIGCGDPYQPVYCGQIWELARTGSSWNFQIAYNLTASTGGAPGGAFTFDQAGKMYGTVTVSGPQGNGGVFQYIPSSSQFNLLYAAPGNVNADYGPQGPVVLDQAGNIYAADPYNGQYFYGYAFEVSPSGGYWTYTDLHNFTGGSDGAGPYGALVVDAQGNVYGANAAGVIFKITR